MREDWRFFCASRVQFPTGKKNTILDGPTLLSWQEYPIHWKTDFFEWYILFHWKFKALNMYHVPMKCVFVLCRNRSGLYDNTLQTIRWNQIFRLCPVYFLFEIHCSAVKNTMLYWFCHKDIHCVGILGF